VSQLSVIFFMRDGSVGTIFQVTLKSAINSGLHLIVKFLNIPTCLFLHVLDQLSIRKLPFKSKDDFSEHVLPSSACIVNVYSDLSEQEAFLIVKTEDDPKVQLYFSAYLLILKMMVPFEYTTNNVWLLFTTVISL
jgi:hypothetical protein